MKTSPEINEIAKSLALAQKAYEAIVKNKNVSYNGKEGKQGKNYNYAPIDEVIGSVRAPLADNGISFIQDIVKDPELGWALLTRLMHSSGQWIETLFPMTLDSCDTMQSLGAVATYSRRYALLQTLGVHPEDEDNDDDQALKNVPKTNFREPSRPTQKPQNVTNQVTINQEQAMELKSYGEKFNYTVDDINKVVTKITGKTKWSEIPLVALNVIKSHIENNKPQLFDADKNEMPSL